MKAALAAIAIVLCMLWSAGSHAQVYRCTSAHGSVAYQDQPCKRGQRQQVIDVPDHGVPSPVVPASGTSTGTPAIVAGVEALPPPTVPAAPRTPLPVMYACVGAVNHEHYLTRSPRPPYLVPLGVLGYPPESLARVYGGPDGVGGSAPELSRPRIGGPRIATGMTQVQDFCLPATHAQICTWVQREYQENQRKLRMAMPHEAPPLEARERELTAQLDNC